MDDVGYAPSSSSSEDVFSEKGSTHYSSSRRVLAHVLARKERDAKQMTQLLRMSFDKLDQESERANDAERRAAECLVRARTAIDARVIAEAEAARYREELGLYKVQLDQAQREIFRAQEVVDGLEARRRDAEEEAVRSRTVARKLQEQRAVDLAREDGRKEGWRDGVRRGWRMGWEEAQGERRARDDRARARPRRGLEDALFSEVGEEPAGARSSSSASESSSLVNVPSRGIPEMDNGGLPYPDIAPMAPAPSVPTLTTPFRSPSPDPQPPSPDRRHTRVSSRSRHRTPEPLQQRPPSQPRHATPGPRFSHAPLDQDPVVSRPYTPGTSHSRSRSRAYTPHESEASIIRPIGVRNTSPSLQHRPISVPPDNWIPTAQDTLGDGRLSIYLPPPHEMVEPPRGPTEPIIVVATPQGSPSVLAQSMPPPGEIQRRDYAYNNPRSAPTLSTSAIPQHIAKAASQNSRGSTHLSEYELLAPVDGQPAPGPSGFRPPEDDELEYIDPPQPVPGPSSSSGPSHSLHRRQNYESGRRKGPPRPREIVFPAPLGPAVEQLAPQPSTSYAHQHAARQDNESPEYRNFDIGRNRPQRSRTQSSGVIGITVEPPSPGNSTPSPDDNGTVISQRDLLSPDHAHRPLTASDHIIGAAGQPPRTLTPLPEFSNLPPMFVPSGSSSSTNVSAPPPPPHHRKRSRTPTYEAAPVPTGVQYPSSPLTHGARPAKRVAAAGDVGPLSPLSNSSGFLGLLPSRLPWRRNTTKE
ncbi:hypothetical protein FA95DRAFT_1187647 [Auriscalpium vulgare]|uniref:Uncharacterized protein n=1 Tax=Auriscalpium vulgare TaxID=40419 RepID=A0ACB8R429_9AGAM|nr:hypothetical protein FA95DRAFT_1187647 [Auriscalpium vulgare]